MELVDRFNSDVWATSDAAKYDGFLTFTIVRPQNEGPGKFKYAIREVRDDDTTECKMDMVTLEGGCGKLDPLASIRNCDLIIKDGNVMGVRIDDECVVKKSIAK